MNDNAFELAEEFIVSGNEFFTKLSNFDDYLVIDVKKENYHAGDTLKLLAPFLKASGICNQDVIDFSKEHIFMVPGAVKTLEFVSKSLPGFIVSTSYEQYISALCDVVNFPFKNTYHTTMDLDKYSLSDSEKNRLLEFKESILKEDYEGIYDIFFNQLSKMEINQLLESVHTVGGVGKRIAVEDIMDKYELDPNGIMYMGDSITDVEALEFAKKHNGLAISFNGNSFALDQAEIAIISDNTIISSILIDLHIKYDKTEIIRFIKEYNMDVLKALEIFDIKEDLVTEFKEIFPEEYPILKLINEDNKEELIRISEEFRKNIRGETIGGLG